MVDETNLSFEKQYNEEDEDISNIKLINQQLKQENEDYQQKLYELQRKFQATEAVQRELQDTNESLEQLLSRQNTETEQKIRNIDMKYRAIETDYKLRLADLEFELAKEIEKNKELHDRFIEYKKSFKEISPIETISIEDSLMPLKDRITELTDLLQLEREKRQSSEETIKELQNQNCEYYDILKVTKEQLKEKSEALEQTREELFACRVEVESLKTAPANESHKGNSLFAEVEDRRQLSIEKLNILRKKYTELKQAFKEKNSEVTTLRAERATLLSKWENNTVDMMNTNMELIKSYKNRITELENKLKAQKKNKCEELQLQSTSDMYSYLQSLLMAKEKEMESLEQKIENNSINALIQEEAKQDIIKQLSYWKYKVMNMKAHILMLKCKLESSKEDKVNREMFLELLQNCIFDKESEQHEMFKESLSILETEKSMENLIIRTSLDTDRNRNETKCVRASSYNLDLETSIIKIKADERIQVDKPYFTRYSPIVTEDIFPKTNYPNCDAVEAMSKTTKTETCVSLKASNVNFDNKSSVKQEVLRFAENTKEPQDITLKKQVNQEYPVLFLSSESNE